MVVEYCLGNVDPAIRRRLRSRPDAREAACLEHCGRCDAGPFLVVDGTVRTAGNHGTILDGADER